MLLLRAMVPRSTTAIWTTGWSGDTPSRRATSRANWASRCSVTPMMRRISWGSFLMTPISWRVSSSEAAICSESLRESRTRSWNRVGEISPGGEARPPEMNSSTVPRRDVVVRVAKDGVFLGGEVVEEGPAGDVGPLADFLHGVAGEAAFRGQGPGDGGDGGPRGGALPLTAGRLQLLHYHSQSKVLH